MLQHFVQLAQAYRALLENAIQQPPVMAGDLYPAEADPPQADAPVCLVFSPHPDDEALVGGLPLRLRAAGWRVVADDNYRER